MRRTWLGRVALATVLLVPLTLSASSKPSATLRIDSKSVAVGVGVEWGNGTLSYGGKRHSFSVDGLSVGDVGASKITAVGNVYHLGKLSDFEGQYAAAEAEGTVGGGAGVTTMRNANGVVINLHSTTRGFKFKAGPDGIKITLAR